MNLRKEFDFFLNYIQIKTRIKNISHTDTLTQGAL